jgi:hypothetical protein
MADAGWGVSFADPGDPQNLPLENAMAANGQGFFLQPAPSSLSWLFGPGPFANSSSSSNSSANPGDINAALPPVFGDDGQQLQSTTANGFRCAAYECAAQMGPYTFSDTQNGVFMQLNVILGTLPAGGQWVQTVLDPTGEYITDNGGNGTSPFYPSYAASGNQFNDAPANGNAYAMTWQAQTSYVAPNQSGASLTVQWGFSRSANGVISLITPFAAAPWFAQQALIQYAQRVLNGASGLQ